MPGNLGGHFDPEADTDDWDVTFFGALGGGTAVGAATLLFGFRSRLMRQYLKFQFVGAGLGAGLFGGYDPQETTRFDCSLADWLALKPSMPKPFSSMDLVSAIGRVGVLSVATPGKAGWGYTRLILTAIVKDESGERYLFDRFDYLGSGAGTGGIAAGVYWGKWVFLGHPSGSEMSTNWTEKPCR